MKRALFIVLLTLISVTAHAEDSVSLWGNYYKERSTRIIQPILVIDKDLPADSHLQFGYAVDQITSASAGGGGFSDTVFHEYRQEVRASLRKRFLGFLTPGVNLKYSHEPDYDSLTAGFSFEAALDRDNTTLKAYVQYQRDDIEDVTNPMFAEESDTQLYGISLTQVLAKNALAGVSFETQMVSGYQENPYRVEQHPRERDRFAGAGFVAYHIEDTVTTARVQYRFYKDSWELSSHTIDLELTQNINPDFDLAIRFREYTQTGVFFTTVTPEGFVTTDPKLFPFNSQYYEASARIWLGALEGSFLDALSNSRIEPAYGFLYQTSSYGPGHILQLGWFWPF